MRRNYCRFIVVAALLAGVSLAPAAGVWIQTTDGKELTGELSVVDGALMVLPTNGPFFKVALTNVREGKFNLTNATESKSGQSGGKSDASLTPPWTASQVGRAGSGGAGTAEFREGAFVLRGVGEAPGDARGGETVFFVHRPLHGDGELVARVVGLSGTAAGLMVRSSLATNAPMAAIYVQSKEMLSFRSRFGNGKGDARDRPYISLPRWVRLKREGNDVRGFLSWDGGEHWESFLKSRFETGSDALIGMFVASGDPTQPQPGRFDNVLFGEGGSSRTGSSHPPAFLAVVMENGSVLTVESLTADSSAVKVIRHGKTITISALKVARLLFDRFGEPDGGQTVPNRPGALLSGADFLDGEFGSVEKNEVKMGSVLFGSRTYRAGGQAKAVSLRALAPLANGFQVRTSDGSVWCTPAMKLEKEGVVLESPAMGTVRLSWREVQSMSQLDHAGR